MLLLLLLLLKVFHWPLKKNETAHNRGVRFYHRTTCKEAKLKEFRFKLIYMIAVKKKELFSFGIKPDDECSYSGEKGSIKHTFIEWHFTKLFLQNVIQWFNETNSCQISPTVEEVFFDIISNTHETKIRRKFHYTTTSMFIYSQKINSETISIHEFLNKQLPVNYNLKNIN